jgi:hypothetical protein
MIDRAVSGTNPIQTAKSRPDRNAQSSPPLWTLHVRPSRDNPCITRGQCGWLLFLRDGLPPLGGTRPQQSSAIQRGGTALCQLLPGWRSDELTGCVGFSAAPGQTATCVVPFSGDQHEHPIGIAAGVIARWRKVVGATVQEGPNICVRSVCRI